MTTSSLGNVTWWAHTPALDLINLTGLDNAVKITNTGKFRQDDSINILLVGAADLRHVLLTLANNKLDHKQIHFYVIECSLEVIARHLLFLSLIMEPPDQLGYQDKTELFMELYGNVLMSSHTFEYLQNKSNDLIRFVTDDDFLKQKLPLLDISLLKFKEKDFLEGIFKFWRNPGDYSFDISKMWENRIRTYLGARFDHRSGIFDWDYSMKLLDLTSVIKRQEYCDWRENGVAFKLRPDAPYDSPNRTLTSGIVVTKNGEKIAQRGYWGDIVNSPYITFGIETNKELLKAAGNHPIKTSQDIAAHNLSEIIAKLSGEKVIKSSSSAKLSPITEVVTTDEKDIKSSRDSNILLNKCLENCKVSLLPLGSATEIGKKRNFLSFFDIAYFSNSMVHNLTCEIQPTFSPHCSVLVESARYMLDLQKESKSEYVKKVTEMALKVGLKLCDTSLQAREETSHLHFYKAASD